ncbi:MAG: hypothetical protein LBM93_06570 [Oscillospiraceae bacterium]|nr:hypothetical protein [Oscillospiraceae bacterium]
MKTGDIFAVDIIQKITQDNFCLRYIGSVARVIVDFDTDGNKIFSPLYKMEFNAWLNLVCGKKCTLELFSPYYTTEIEYNILSIKSLYITNKNNVKTYTKQILELPDEYPLLIPEVIMRRYWFNINPN